MMIFGTPLAFVRAVSTSAEIACGFALLGAPLNWDGGLMTRSVMILQMTLGEL
jgi:hypothetical protein